MKFSNNSIKLYSAQQGVVLAVALIMLVLITLLAVSGMRSTIMEERMASNSRNTNVAFQMAETALRDAEARLNADPDSLNISKAQAQNVGFGSCEVVLNTPLNWANACNYVGTADDNVSKSPHYFIEFLNAKAPLNPAAPQPRECFYRITARGYGPDPNSVVTLQTTYRFDACL